MQKMLSAGLNGRKNKIVIADAAAVVVFTGLFLAYLKISLHSVNVGDESFYLTIPHRLVSGDGLIVDEWHVSQFSSLLLAGPFALYYKLAGSADGVVLFFRLLYSVCQTAVCAFLYISLRKYTSRGCDTGREKQVFAFFALAGVTVFACFIPACIPTLGYYTMSLMGSAVVGATLFCYPMNRARAFFAGVVFAAVVLAEPLTAAVYFIYAVLFAINGMIGAVGGKKISSELFERRFFLFSAAGIFALAVPVVIFLLVRSGAKDIVFNIKHLFDGVEYSFSAGGNIIDLSLYGKMLELYGRYNFIFLGVLTLLAALLYKFREKTRPFFAAAILCFLVVSYVHAWNYIKECGSVRSAILYHGFPVYFCGPVCALISAKNDRRLFSLWCTGAVFSLIFGISSDISLGIGGIFSGMSCILFFGKIFVDGIYRSSPSGKHSRVIACVLAAASVLFVCTNEIGWLKCQSTHYMVESELTDHVMRGELDAKLEKGPLKGIRTTPAVAEEYDKMLKDLDFIKNEGREPVFVCSLAPWYYLYLDEDYGTYSAWFNELEFDRLFTYWQEHPEKIPGYVYLPYRSIYTYKRIDRSVLSDFREKLSEVFEYGSVDGEAGEMIRVKQYLGK